MSSVVPAPDFQRLFLATDAPMGQTWLRSARIQLSKVALHHLALASKVPSVSNARDAYGHFRTASQMNKVPGRYWKPGPDLVNSIQQASQLLNPQPVPTPMARLISLRSEAPFFSHATHRVTTQGNVRAYSTFLDESLNAVLRTVSIFAHRANQAMRIFQLFNLQGAMGLQKFVFGASEP